MGLYLVIGPPAGGKSTWVKQRARHGDITIDYDALANTLTPPSDKPHQHSPEVKAVTKAARQAAIDTALQFSNHVDVYLIHSSPSTALIDKYRRVGAEVVVIDPGYDVVMARAKAERPWWMQKVIKDWYASKPPTPSGKPRGKSALALGFFDQPADQAASSQVRAPKRRRGSRPAPHPL